MSLNSIFANTLAEQEAELADNPLLRRFAESRAAMADDPHRPLYHFVSPENLLNDPNGLCFWQGRWHLFYQGYPPEDPRQHWGHAVSDDLIHWRDLPYAIYPNPEECCFSGAALVEEDRVIAMYHGTKVGNMVAVSDDPLLLNWEKLTGQAVIPIASEDGSPLALSSLRSLHLEQRWSLLRALRRHVAPCALRQAHRCRLPLPFGGPGSLGISAPLRRRRPLHLDRRRRRLSLFLAHR